MSGASNDGGEDSPGGVISGKPGLAHTGAIVHNKSGNLVVTHFDLKSCVGGLKKGKKENIYLATKDLTVSSFVLSKWTWDKKR